VATKRNKHHLLDRCLKIVPINNDASSDRETPIDGTMLLCIVLLISLCYVTMVAYTVDTTLFR